MTKEEIQAVWTRYMHRADLAADYDDTWLFASNTVLNRLMYTPVDMDALRDTQPQLFVHAGLMYLAELAQDDVQLERETMKFTTTADTFMRMRSIQTPAIMQKGLPNGT